MNFGGGFSYEMRMFVAGGELGCFAFDEVDELAAACR